jgi:hypothetical protein
VPELDLDEIQQSAAWWTLMAVPVYGYECRG